MKIVLTTTFLVAVLAIGIFGTNSVFAQGNDTMVMNATLPATIISEATLVYAQGNDTSMMGNDTGVTMNATLAFAQGNDTMSMGGNDTSMTMNVTLPISVMGNGTSN